MSPIADAVIAAPIVANGIDMLYLLVVPLVSFPVTASTKIVLPVIRSRATVPDSFGRVHALAPVNVALSMVPVKLPLGNKNAPAETLEDASRIAIVDAVADVDPDVAPAMLVPLPKM